MERNALAGMMPRPAAAPAPANALAGLMFDPRYSAVASNPTPQYDTTVQGARDYALDPNSRGNRIVMGFATNAATMNVPRGAVQGVRAYHGSPHRFDRFDMSRIGSGEGAQAYGHGLYFAENEGVARNYRAAGAQSAIARLDGVPIAEIPNKSGVLDWLDSYGSVANTRIALQGRRPELLRELDDMLSSGRLREGHMYEVNLRVDPNRLLDWDAPLARQPQAVREMFESGPLSRARETVSAYRTPDEVTGRVLYEGTGLTEGMRRQGSVSGPESEILASRALRELGIPGVQYLDQGSRGAGQGTRNYVIFDDALIDIVRRYGLAALLGGGAAAAGAGTAEAAQ